MQQKHGEDELCRDTICNTKIQDKIATSEIETLNFYSFPPIPFPSALRILSEGLR